MVESIEISRLLTVHRLADDEKFLFKPELKLEQCNQFAFQNARDVIACGFKPEKTFIFSDLDFVGCVDRRRVILLDAEADRTLR